MRRFACQTFENVTTAVVAKSLSEDLRDHSPISGSPSVVGRRFCSQPSSTIFFDAALGSANIPKCHGCGCQIYVREPFEYLQRLFIPSQKATTVVVKISIGKPYKDPDTHEAVGCHFFVGETMDKSEVDNDREIRASTGSVLAHIPWPVADFRLIHGCRAKILHHAVVYICFLRFYDWFSSIPLRNG